MQKLTKKQDDFVDVGAYVLMIIGGLILLWYNLYFSLRSVGIILGTWLIVSAYKTWIIKAKLKKMKEVKNV